MIARPSPPRLARTALGLLLLAALSLAAVRLWPTRAIAPYRAAGLDCARHSVVDATTGAALAGIEDIARIPDGSGLVLSAYDRRAVRRHDDPATPPPRGGLYRLSTEALGGGARDTDAERDAPLRAVPLTAAVQAELDLRPHGIGAFVDAAGGGLIAVNRRADLLDGRWDIRTTVERFAFAADGNSLTHRATLDDPALCRANDVASVDGARLVVSRDHASCDDFGAGIEDAFGRREGLLLAYDGDNTAGQVVADELFYPNGVALTEAALYVAVTRARALRRFDADGTPRDAVALDFGPDNLSVDADGALVIAGSAALFDLFRYRMGWLGRAGSEVWRYRPASGDLTPLLRDPGELISGASVAIEHAGHLVIGSAYDRALAVCTRAPGLGDG